MEYHAEDVGQAWAAVEHPNPAELAMARQRWRAGDDDHFTAAAPERKQPWLKESYTVSHSSRQAPERAGPSYAAGVRSAQMREATRDPTGRIHDNESLVDQLRTLKKELASCQAENRLLRVGKERAQAELRKAEYEGEQALKSGAIVDGSGAAGARPEVRLLKQLKAKTRQMEEELATKEATIGEMGGQSRGVRVRELEIQTKTYLEEARRLKEVSRLLSLEKEDALAALRDDHAAALALKDGQLEDARKDSMRCPQIECGRL